MSVSEYEGKIILHKIFTTLRWTFALERRRKLFSLSPINEKIKDFLKFYQTLTLLGVYTNSRDGDKTRE